ncbi:MAG TPA: type III-A CRISPR-associated RAMP protein Csm3 [Exilispira sp.]|nr:type III-A CRISPR-associated RAMP protein Csm3 [Exilispira sp.]
MKLKKIKKITGKLIVKTGLHIGAGNDNLEIGGMDNPVVRNPINGEPYIPGSSLKGKIRYLLEWDNGKFGLKIDKNTGEIKSYEPCDCGEPDCIICRIFGTSNTKTRKNDLGPTRVIFRDAFLNKDFVNNSELDSFIEEKYENTIDRVTAKANPRSMERVVPETVFDIEIIYKVYDCGDGGKKDEDYFEKLKRGLRLLELDYLGGGGSRGNGKIKFEELKDEEGKEITLPEKL